MVVDLVAPDGMIADEVGPWAKEKHLRLRHYLDIARGARKRYLGAEKGGASYIDPYCGAGLARIRGSDEWIDGSPVVAWRIAREGGAPFSEMHISDTDPKNVDAAAARLRALGANVYPRVGRADEIAPVVASKINPYGLHFAFLDPFNLGDLPFSVIEALGKLKRMDMLVHVSVQDLHRNFARYLGSESSPLDRFAPGWRSLVTPHDSERESRRKVLERWMQLAKGLGKEPSTDAVELVTGSRNQPLYWLLLIAGHQLAHSFWRKVSDPSGQRDLF